MKLILQTNGYLNAVNAVNSLSSDIYADNHIYKKIKARLHEDNCKFRTTQQHDNAKLVIGLGLETIG